MDLDKIKARIEKELSFKKVHHSSMEFKIDEGTKKPLCHITFQDKPPSSDHATYTFIMQTLLKRIYDIIINDGFIKNELLTKDELVKTLSDLDLEANEAIIISNKERFDELILLLDLTATNPIFEHSAYRARLLHFNNKEKEKERDRIILLINNQSMAYADFELHTMDKRGTAYVELDGYVGIQDSEKIKIY